MFDEKDIVYSRIDYSQYGVLHFYITMYEDSPKNKKLESRAENYLNNIERLYHTLYYFIKVPVGSSTEQKEKLLFQFLKVLKIKEAVAKVYLHLNLDEFNISTNSINEFKKSYNDTISIKTEIDSKNLRNFY